MAKKRLTELDTGRSDNAGVKRTSSPKATVAENIRTTIVISATLDLNLEVCRIKLANMNGRTPSKNDVIKLALEQFVTKHGGDPKVRPTV